MPDPFTSTASAILGALRASPGFTAIVAPGNVIDMTSDRFEQFKKQVQPADLPEVILLQGEFALRPFGINSRTADLSQTWQMIVTHDSLRVRPVNALKYQTMAALLKAGTTLGMEGLVRGWEITDGRDDALGKNEWKRGTARWTSVLSITVQMYLMRQQIVAQS
jgi:hypothetical protein